MNKLLLLLLLLSFAPALTAQRGARVLPKMELDAYLGERNIDRDELRRRLEARGIFVDNMTREEAVLARPRIEAVIEEMELEKARFAADTIAPKLQLNQQDQTEAISDAVDGGASVEEAVSEVVNEQATDTTIISDIYGHQIFRNKSLQVYRATENATPPDSYPLKPGDEIAVTIFGASQTDFILRLDQQGFVQLPNSLRIPLGGLPLGEARTLLTRRLKRFYTFRDGELNIRTQAARTITVNIFGEVENNGGFTMSSLNTGFNALVAAGGPTEAGSVRNIQLIRGAEKILLDVYAYLQSPTQSSDLFLENNATIYVPLAEKVVKLEGGVARPLRYELKDDENLTDLIAFAGGLRGRAESSNIRVTRYVAGQLEVFNVDLTTQPNFALVDDDVIEIPIVENPIENFVTIEGAVLLPGRYAFGDGVTTDELLQLGRLRPEARQDEAFLFRTNDDGTSRLIRLNIGADAGAEPVELQRGDRLRILSSVAFTDQATFTVAGAIRDSSVTLPFPQDGALSLAEAILLVGGLNPNAAAEVMLIRTPLNNRQERKYERVNLQDGEDFELEAFDRVVVYEQEDFTDVENVTISGAVRNSGTYTYDPSLTLPDLLYLANGLRIDADRDRVDVFRLTFVAGAETRTLVQTLGLDDIGTFTLQPFDEVVVRSTAEFELIRNVVVEGEVRYPGPYAILRDNERLSDIIQRAGGLTAEAFAPGATLFRADDDKGYVVLDLDEVALNPADPANIVLLQNDTVYIPKKQELVTIFTRNTLIDKFGRDSTTADGVLQVAYRGEKSAGWYINNYAGGFDDESARKRWTTVEYANGQVQETNSFLGIRSYPPIRPGASIRIADAPPKRVRERREERFNWIGLTQIIVTAATTLTTFILIRN